MHSDSLTSEGKKRYEKKLNLVVLQKCPYELGKHAWKDDLSQWPAVDIVLYLIGIPGEFTREKLKACKSLEAYNYFSSGWVGICFIHEVNSQFSVLKAEVRPSQRLSDRSHSPWVGVRKNDGSISTAHCTCMAG